MHDPSLRRGIWYGFADGQFYLIGGREGDDAAVTFQVGETISEEKLKQLGEVLDCGSWVVEEYGPEGVDCIPDLKRALRTQKGE